MSFTSSELGTPIHSPKSESVTPPSPSLEPKGGTHSPKGEGMGGGGPNSDDWRKSLALCILCGLIVFLASGADKNER